MFLDKFARKLGVLEYLGTWNASTNTPTLTSSQGQKGGYYIVSVSGSTSLNGITDWSPGDWAVFNGTAWQKVDNSEPVVVVDSTSGSQTTQAPSVAAIKSFINNGVATDVKNVISSFSESGDLLDKRVTAIESLASSILPTSSYAKLNSTGITYTATKAGTEGGLAQVQQSQGGKDVFRFDLYNSTSVPAFKSAFPNSEPNWRPDWTTGVGNTTGMRMMFRVDTESGIAFNTIIGEPGYDDASQSGVSGFVAGVSHSFSGYYDTQFAQQGFQSHSVKEIGYGAGLDGKAGERIKSIKVTFDTWNDAKYSAWSSDSRYTSSAGFTLPVTISVYELSASGAEAGRLLGKVTQQKLMQWCPSNRNSGGYSFNVSFDMASANILVPASEKVVVSVAYNTNTRGYSPVGQSGPYDSLGVGLMEKVYDSGNGDVTYGTSAGSLVSDNGFYWCNTLAVGSEIGHIDFCKSKSLSVINTGKYLEVYKTILATDSSGEITSTTAQVASAVNGLGEEWVSAAGDSTTATVLPISSLSKSESYVASLSWSGAGPYTMAINSSVHGRGTDPVIRVRELSGSDYVDVSITEIKVAANGDVTLSHSSNLTGKVIIK